ncbi:hypothetical protein HDE_02199 [Halotydeus destructor]|nr:hypothetical protein HDE_02199 [Halotydeus destructor]
MNELKSVVDLVQILFTMNKHQIILILAFCVFAECKSFAIPRSATELLQYSYLRVFCNQTHIDGINYDSIEAAKVVCKQCDLDHICCPIQDGAECRKLPVLTEEELKQIFGANISEKTIIEKSIHF